MSNITVLNTSEDASTSKNETSGTRPFMMRLHPEIFTPCYYDMDQESHRFYILAYTIQPWKGIPRIININF